MDGALAVRWLHRRAGFGLHPDAVAELAATTTSHETALATLTRSADLPDDPWAGLALDRQDGGRREAIVGWVTHLIDTRTPFVDRRAWELHGWLVSSFDKVPIPAAMTAQIELFRHGGGSSYPKLLENITIDPAMLAYLDGRLSTGTAPNENYARELMELFALGVGHYDEADVQAAAVALTGWVTDRELTDARFVPRRHADSAVTVLGRTGVTDVAGVIDAVVAHPAHAPFVANKIVEIYLGDPNAPALAGVADSLAEFYVANGYQLDLAIEQALRLGLAGHHTPLVQAPIPWLVNAARVTQVPTRRVLAAAQGRTRETGQVPMLPPNVAGWPRGAEWFTTSSMIARTNIAAELADATPSGEPLRLALEDGDLDTAALHLGLSEPFGPSTAATIRAENNITNRITLALVCPENLLS